MKERESYVRAVMYQLTVPIVMLGRVPPNAMPTRGAITWYMVHPLFFPPAPYAGPQV